MYRCDLGDETSILILGHLQVSSAINDVEITDKKRYPLDDGDVVRILSNTYTFLSADSKYTGGSKPSTCEAEPPWTSM